MPGLKYVDEIISKYVLKERIKNFKYHLHFFNSTIIKLTRKFTLVVHVTTPTEKEISGSLKEPFIYRYFPHVHWSKFTSLLSVRETALQELFLFFHAL